jgi:hypothetical protein
LPISTYSRRQIEVSWGPVAIAEDRATFVAASFSIAFMPIQVTCPGCLTRFQVNDKFAGKKGPCPKCKNQIQIPEPGDAVVIHNPEGDGPKDSSGKLVLKPIARQETRTTRFGIVMTIGAVVLAIAGAAGLRTVDPIPLLIKIFGVLVIAPPLVWAGYSFARDQELDAYRGKELWTRVSILSVVFAASWAIYAFVPAYLFDLEIAANADYWLVGVALAVMMVVGTFAAVATFELETGNGFAVAALYYVSVLLLALIAGIPLAGVPFSTTG